MIHEAETLLQEFAAYARDTEHQEDILSLYLVVDPAQRYVGQDEMGAYPAAVGEFYGGL